MSSGELALIGSALLATALAIATSATPAFAFSMDDVHQISPATDAPNRYRRSVSQPSEPAVIQAVPRGLAPFTTDEVEELELYRDLVAELGEWELANRQQIELAIGSHGVLADGLEKADLVALATSFRKLGWAEKEPATFNKVRNMLGNHAHQAQTPEAAVVGQWLKDLRDLRAAALQQSRVLAYELEHPDGSTESMTPMMVLDLLINGAVFHTDNPLRKRWEELGGWKSPALVLIAVVTVWDLIRMFEALDTVVERALEEPTLRPAAATHPTA